jgi:hypothetical protein
MKQTGNKSKPTSGQKGNKMKPTDANNKPQVTLVNKPERRDAGGEAPFKECKPGDL